MNVIHNAELKLGGYDRARGGSVTLYQDIYNRMGVPIYVIMRNGCNYVVHPSIGGAGRSNVDNTIIIDNRFQAGVNCDLNVTNHPYISEPANKRLYDQWVKSGEHDLSYHMIIHADELTNGSVYVDVFDIVISIKPPGEIPPHPRTQKSFLSAAAKLLDFTQGFTFQVKLVNNSIPVEELSNNGKYININGVVARIQPIHDCYVPNGLYILTNESCNKDHWRYYEDSDSACPIVLYDLPEVAQSRGDIGKRLEEENRIRVQELKVRETQYKSDLLELTRRYEEEQRSAELQHKEQLRIIEQDRAKSDAEFKAKLQQMDLLSKSTEQIMATNLMRQKAMYEGISHARKNTSENIKMIPTILNFITTFFKF